MKSFTWLAVLLVSLPIDARTRRGDKLMMQGSEAEHQQRYDQALALYEQALREDPRDAHYRSAVARTRFLAAQAHVRSGRKLRMKGMLQNALIDFEKAYAIDPSMAIAAQEAQRTRALLKPRARKLGR